MGAILSQAVANQLRQYPGSQNPRPSPPELIQQVLNPPGPSLPTWMGPVMENRQLLATNTPEARQALAQDALKAAMAFGGADITKEQRLAWEKENAEYRASKTSGESLTPGTRVHLRAMRTPEELAQHRAIYGHYPAGHAKGTVVKPGTPEAGEPGYRLLQKVGSPDPRAKETPPTPQHIAVRGEGSGYWFWRHRNDLEILPPRYLYKQVDPSELPQWRANPFDNKGFHEDPATAEYYYNEYVNDPYWKSAGRSPTTGPPVRLRISEGATKFTPGTPAVWHKGDAMITRGKLPLDKIEVEVADGQWMPLSEWLKKKR